MDSTNITSTSQLNPVSKIKITRKTIWIIGILLILVIVGGYAYYSNIYLPSQTTTTEPELQIATVRQGQLVIYASGTGTLVAVDEVALAFKTAGQVTDISVKVGDQVKAGDVLAQVDDTDVQIAYLQAKRSLAELSSVAAVATAQQEIAQATTDLQDAIGHLQYIISPSVYRWELEVAKDKQAVKDAQATVDANPSDADAQNKLKQAENVLKYAQDSLASANDSYETYYIPKYFTVEERDEETHKLKKVIYPPLQQTFSTRAQD